MTDAGFLQRAHCIHPAPEKVQDKRFQEKGSFFDPKNIMQAKYELLRSCIVEDTCLTEINDKTRAISGKDWKKADFGLSEAILYSTPSIKATKLNLSCLIVG